MALVKLEDIKKLLDENKINLKDLEKLSTLEEIKKKNEKIIGQLDRFEKLVNNKKLSELEKELLKSKITDSLQEE